MNCFIQNVPELGLILLSTFNYNPRHYLTGGEFNNVLALLISVGFR